jgi:hypothetical protein
MTNAPPDSACEPTTRPPGLGHWGGLLLGIGLSLLLYQQLLGLVPDLHEAEPSYAGQIFPWVASLSKEDIVRVHEARGPALQRAAAPLFLVLLGALFLIYAFMLLYLSRYSSRAWEAVVVTAGAGFLALQLTGPATLSVDMYWYAQHGRALAVYHGDPYSDNPAIDPDDPYLKITPYESSPYGPLWIVVAAGVAWVGGLNLGLTILLFRGLAVLCVLAIVALVRAYLKTATPQHVLRGQVLFLWNPLVVLEAGLSGHNDCAMLALFLLGIWLYLRGWPVLALAGFTLSLLVKYVTGLLVPLYVLLVLRQLPSWSRRLRYAGLGVLTMAVTAGLVVGLFRLGIGEPPARDTQRTGELRQHALGLYYANSVQELLLPVVRTWLGEDPELVHISIDFKGWWVKTKQATHLGSEPEAKGEPIDALPEGTPLLVLAPQESNWVYVYNPQTGHRGYIPEEAEEETEAPAGAEDDPQIALLAEGPSASPILWKANWLLRLPGWAALLLLGLVAAWRIANLKQFVFWSATLVLALYWLVGAHFYPWYVTWGLALTALIPASRPALLAGLLSATSLSLYATLGAEDWYEEYRALPALVLPLVLFLAIVVVQRLTWTAPGPRRIRAETGSA